MIDFHRRVSDSVLRAPEGSEYGAQKRRHSQTDADARCGDTDARRCRVKETRDGHSDCGDNDR